MKVLLFSFALVLISSTSLLAQFTLPVDSSTLTNLKSTHGIDTGLVDKAKTKIVSSATDVKDHYKTEVNSSLGKFNILNKINHSQITFNGSVSADGEYISNSAIPVSANGFYYRTGVNGGVKIGQLPFNTGVTVNYRNNRVWTDYTLMNFTFDSKGFVSNLKNSYLDYLSDIGNFYSKELADMVKSYEDSLTSLGDLKNTLTDKSYYDKLREFNADYKTLGDSLAKNNTDSCLYADYTRVSDSINHYKGMAKEYADLEKYKQANPELQQYLDTYHGYVDSVKNMKNVLSVAGIKDQLSKTGILSKAEEKFSGVQKLGIGRVTLNLSDFTARSQSIYGINFDYLIKNIIYTGIGLGITSPNNFQFNPSFSTINKPIKFNFNRWLGYLRLGIGRPEEDHLHLIYLSYGDKFNSGSLPASTYQAAPANSVLALVYKKTFMESAVFEGEFATSNSSDSNRVATFAPFETSRKNKQFNFALRTMLSGTIKKTSTFLSIKGTAISANYRSAGNLFQRRDYAEYTAAIRQPLGDKLTLGTQFTHNFSGLFSGTGRSSFINMYSTANIVASRFAQYTLSHNFIKQMPQGTGANFTSHIVSAIQQYTYGKEKVRGLTALNFSYTDTKTGGGEIPANSTRIFQGGAMQTVTFAKGISVNANAGVSATQMGGRFQNIAYWVQTGNTFSIKSKCNIGYSFKYLRDPAGFSNYFTTANITATLYKGLQFKVNEQLQVIAGVHQTINTQTTAGLSYTFSYTLKKTLSFKIKKKEPKVPLLDF